MEERVRIITQGGVGEIVEKKSRFIATVVPVHSQEEAQEIIAQKKKEYWDARHNCYAYIIGNNCEIMRCSDDGEPAQTAGRPMLDVLLNHHLTNVLVIVTRYFGGVLLGTGGLVRAYQGATKAGLDQCVLMEKHSGYRLQITTDYNQYGKIEFVLREMGLALEDTQFAADVLLSLRVDEALAETVIKKITDTTSGTAHIEKGDLIDFYM